MLFQGKGPETITIMKMPAGLTAIFYIEDFKDSLSDWRKSNAVVRIYKPNGGKVTRVNLNDNKGEKYFIVGCFNSSGLTSFKEPSGNRGKRYIAKDKDPRKMTKLTKSEIHQICG